MGLCISERTVTSLFYTLFWRNRAGKMDGQRIKQADGQTDGFLGIFITLDKRISKNKMYLKEIPKTKHAE
jgi:hypothetical protein